MGRQRKETQAARRGRIASIISASQPAIIRKPPVGAAPVTGGPYRFLRHPNYLAVVLEMAAVPLIHGAWLTALVFSALNAALLAHRIPAEERALGRAYAEVFSERRRLVPGGPRG